MYWFKKDLTSHQPSARSKRLPLFLYNSFWAEGGNENRRYAIAYDFKAGREYINDRRCSICRAEWGPPTLFGSASRLSEAKALLESHNEKSSKPWSLWIYVKKGYSRVYYSTGQRSPSSWLKKKKEEKTMSGPITHTLSLSIQAQHHSLYWYSCYTQSDNINL